MLRILGVKPGHDGCVALLRDGQLEFALEAEKNNGHRYSELNRETLFRAFELADGVPEVLAESGWSIGAPDGESIGGGYTGIGDGKSRQLSWFGKNLKHFSSSHERSHLLCAYGMSPFPQGKPCYALVWEGHIGNFYLIDERVRIHKLSEILPFPGVRFAFLFGLADPFFALPPGQIRLSDAGKLMAITGYARTEVDADGAELVRRILDPNLSLEDLDKERFKPFKYHNCGVQDRDFAAVAKHLSDSLFEYFRIRIGELVSRRLPLLISGGCGLNCDWNTRWRETGLFEDVFVPPCANDTGSAIGTAVDAQLSETGGAKIGWSVYSGESPVEDLDEVRGFQRFEYRPERVALALAQGSIVAWLRGRYEIGPRALGARSILASPLEGETLGRLNRIKKREGFRPIAPVCLEECLARYFSPAHRSPYMLEFRTVVEDSIPAVTHVDRSARPQSVNEVENRDLYHLISAFKEKTGTPVLCNTSLNFNGRGFINSLSDVREFALTNGLDGFVFNDSFYVASER